MPKNCLISLSLILKVWSFFCTAYLLVSVTVCDIISSAIMWKSSIGVFPEIIFTILWWSWDGKALGEITNFGSHFFHLGVFVTKLVSSQYFDKTYISSIILNFGFFTCHLYFTVCDRIIYFPGGMITISGSSISSSDKEFIYSSFL